MQKTARHYVASYWYGYVIGAAAGACDRRRMIEQSVPEALIDALGRCGLAGSLIGKADTARLGVESGAYLLLLRLPRPVAIRGRPSWPESLTMSWYLYAGNAHGPGGLRGRLSRHFRAPKTAHWHIDRLTAEAELHAIAYPGRNECDLVAALETLSGITIPAPGFGSSDCRTCRSHLLAWRAR